MGDENSLQGRTQAHKHSADSSTGGFLETGVTGITNLSNGSIVYGDATEQVTELNSGNLNDILTMGATLPQWSAPAGGGATWEILYDSGVLAVAGGLGTGVISAPDKFIKVFFYGATTASITQGITFNNSNGAVEYAFQSQRDFTTLVQFNSERSTFISGGFNTNNPMLSEMTIWNDSSTDDKLIHVNTVINSTTGNTFPTSYQVFGKWYGGAEITQMNLVNGNAGTGVNFAIGSRMLVLATT